jgi:hypothetical protein
MPAGLLLRIVMFTSKRVSGHFSSGLAIMGCLVGTAFAQEDDLVGTWDCGLEYMDPSVGAAITADFDMTYDADGTYTRAGRMDIAIAAFQVDISIVMDEAGKWRLVDSTALAETPTSLTFSAEDEMPTEMEQMIFQQMQAEANASLEQEETTDITSLTSTSMVLASEGGGALTCAKT